MSCDHINDQTFIPTEDDNCPLCAQKIDEENHEMEIVYELSLSREEIQECNKHIYFSLFKIFFDHDYQANLDALVLRLNTVIPLVGAGFSMPLGAPNWKDLFLTFTSYLPETHQPAYLDYIHKFKFFEGARFLFDFSKSISEDYQLKEIAASKIREMIRYDKKRTEHNYVDLLNINFPYFFTTNYDNALTHFNYRGVRAIPIELEEIKDIQRFVWEPHTTVIHLHGVLTKSQSLVLTKKDYEEKYSSEEFVHKMSALMSQKSLLFLGFSLSDEHFNELYGNIHKKIGGTHFLVTDNSERADTFIGKGIYSMVLKIENDNERIAAQHYLLKYLEVLHDESTRQRFE